MGGAPHSRSYFRFLLRRFFQLQESGGDLRARPNTGRGFSRHGSEGGFHRGRTRRGGYSKSGKRGYPYPEGREEGGDRGGQTRKALSTQEHHARDRHQGGRGELSFVGASRGGAIA